MSGQDDAELSRLMLASMTGDEKAYAALLGSLAAAIRAYCRRRIAAGTLDAEDIVQETLLAIHMKRHTWDRNAPVMPWVYAIARYKLVDAFRSRGRRIEVDIDDVADLVAAPEADAISPREIDRILETLPAGQKAAVAAISVEGLSIPETAVKLGMAETAVRVALHRGLASIAQRVGRGS